jgi:hypothetical protein
MPIIGVMGATIGTGGAALLSRAPAGGIDPFPLLVIPMFLWLAVRPLRLRPSMPVAVAAIAAGALWATAVEAFGVARPVAALLVIVLVAGPLRRASQS